MPFLTQGKTNWKYILVGFCVIIILLGFGAGLGYLYMWKERREVRFPKDTLEDIAQIECKEFRAGIKTDLDIDKGIGIYYTKYIQPPKGAHYSIGPYIKFGKFIGDTFYHYDKPLDSYETEEEFSEGEIVLIDDNLVKKINSKFNSIESFHKIVESNIEILRIAKSKCSFGELISEIYQPSVYRVYSTTNNEVILLYDFPITIPSVYVVTKHSVFVDVYNGTIQKVLVYGIPLE